MATVFRDNKAILLVKYLLQGGTINVDRYCQVLTKLGLALKWKHLGLLSQQLLFHDNARPHSTQQTKDLLKQFKWKFFDCPPYSPDLALS